MKGPNGSIDKTAAVVTGGGGRLYSLDALRGLTVAAMVLVNNPGDWSRIYAPLRHAAWHGWTFTDTIFPAFLFIAGISMVISIDRSLASHLPRRTLLLRLWRRGVTIIAIGLAINLVPAFDFSTLRWPGVLQRIGLCIVITAPMVLWSSLRGLGGWALVLMATYTALMFWIPVPGADSAISRGSLEAGRDTGAFVDRWLMAGHLWTQAKTWDPEGLLSSLPAAATLLLGALVARFLQPSRVDAHRTLLVGLSGVGALALGALLDAFFMPINKSLWTPSYAVFMSGFAAVGFSVCYWLVDGASSACRRWPRALLLPFVMFGVNALAIFALSGLVGRLLGTLKVAGEAGQLITVKAWLFGELSRLPLAPVNASLLYAMLFVLCMFAVAWLLWRKQIILKV